MVGIHIIPYHPRHSPTRFTLRPSVNTTSIYDRQTVTVRSPTLIVQQPLASEAKLGLFRPGLAS
jgi:hypothetical protein